MPRPLRLSLRPAVAVVCDFQVEKAVRPGLERVLPKFGKGPRMLPGQGVSLQAELRLAKRVGNDTMMNFVRTGSSSSIWPGSWLHPISHQCSFQLQEGGGPNFQGDVAMCSDLLPAVYPRRGVEPCPVYDQGGSGTPPRSYVQRSWPSTPRQLSMDALHIHRSCRTLNGCILQFIKSSKRRGFSNG